jgi:hypothetical protein
MAKKIKITRKDKFLVQDQFLQLFQDFINDSYSGRRVKSNGTRISNGTISNYVYCQNNILDFVGTNTFELKIYIVNHLTQNEKERAKRYNQKILQIFHLTFVR